MSSSGSLRERAGGYLKRDLFFAERRLLDGERSWRNPGETLLIGYTIKQC